MDVRRLLWDFRTSGPVSHSVKTACCLLPREEHLEWLWAGSGRVFFFFLIQGYFKGQSAGLRLGMSIQHLSSVRNDSSRWGVRSYRRHRNMKRLSGEQAVIEVCALLTEDSRRADARSSSHQISWQGDKSMAGNGSIFFLIFPFLDTDNSH